MSAPYFNQSVQEALDRQQASPTGLSAGEVSRRQAQYGPNKLSEGKRKTVFQVFLEQFKDLLVVILIIAAGISALSDNLESTLVIFAVLILNAVLGTVQYVKAEKSLESLKAMSAPTAKVCATASGPRSPRRSWCPETSCCWRPAIWWWPTAGFWRISPSRSMRAP